MEKYTKLGLNPHNCGTGTRKFGTDSRAVPKLLAFLIPIFRNVDGSWRVTSKLRGSTLIQVARRRLKAFQRFSASLVRVGDVQGVSRRHAVRGKKEHHIGVLLGV